MAIQIMGKFTAIGMRTAKAQLPIPNRIINTCGQNDTAERGDTDTWVWSNPTNRAIVHPYHDIQAVSVECLWQGTKILQTNMIAAMTQRPDQLTLRGDWRRGKAKKPQGAYAGPGAPLITSPGLARRAIYIPAYKRLVEHWRQDGQVNQWIQDCKQFEGHIFLRDHDTGRGLDRNGPMSHAWLLCMFLNDGVWPD